MTRINAQRGANPASLAALLCAAFGTSVPFRRLDTVIRCRPSSLLLLRRMALKGPKLPFMTMQSKSWVGWSSVIALDDG